MKNRLLLLLVAFLFTNLTVSAQSWLWGVQGNPGLKEYIAANNIATNRRGNVYQIGGFENSITFGTYTLTTSSIFDIFLVKYDQNSNILWAAQSKTRDTTSYSSGYSIATDDSDNSYITGYAGDITIFGNDTLYENNQLFLIKYDPNGNVVWAKQPDTNKVKGTGYAVATDVFRHEYVTGSGGFLIKYDKNGNIIWTVKPTSTDSNNNTYGYSVAPDIFGNVYVSGQFIDSLTFGTYKLYAPIFGVFIAKFDSNGNVLWAQQSINNTSELFGYGGCSVAVDRSGAAYLTGTFPADSAVTIMLGSFTFKGTSILQTNFFVVKYNPGGTIAWGKEAIPININYNYNYGWNSCSVCTDDSNHIYISGGGGGGIPQLSFAFANDTISFTNYALDPSFLLKLDSSGNVICGSALRDGGGVNTNAVSSDSTGRFVYLGGEFQGVFVLGNDTLIEKLGEDYNFVGRWRACNECDLTVISIPQSSSVCEGQGVLLTASGGTYYTWSPTNGLSKITGDSVTATPLVTTTYTVTVTNLPGCVGEDTDVVIINPAPDKPMLSQHDSILTTNATQGIQWSRNDTVIPGATTQNYTITIAGWYKVVVVNPANGCSATSDSMYFSPTGLNQLTVESGQVTVYPNPTGSEIFVNINSAVAEVKDWNLQVTDVLGRTLIAKSSLSYSNDIDLSNLSSGVYFITVIAKTGRTAAVVVKN